jgi:hypothetical protein
MAKDEQGDIRGLAVERVWGFQLPLRTAMDLRASATGELVLINKAEGKPVSGYPGIKRSAELPD